MRRAGQRSPDGAAHDRDSGVAVGDHDPLGAPARGDVFGGQRQSVASCWRGVVEEIRVVFLDEPTAALGVAQTRQVLDLVKRLGEQGLAVVLAAQSDRRLRGRRPEPRCCGLVVRRRLREVRHQRAGDRAGHYLRRAGRRGRPVERRGAPRGVGGRRRRTASPTSARARAAEAFKGGDEGKPTVGIIAITIFFTAKSNIFFTAVNFSNLIGQMAGVTGDRGRDRLRAPDRRDRPVRRLRQRHGGGRVPEAGSSHDYPGLVAIGLAVEPCAAIGRRRARSSPLSACLVRGDARRALIARG